MSDDTSVLRPNARFGISMKPPGLIWFLDILHHIRIRDIKNKKISKKNREDRRNKQQAQQDVKASPRTPHPSDENHRPAQQRNIDN